LLIEASAKLFILYSSMLTQADFGKDLLVFCSWMPEAQAVIPAPWAIKVATPR
jgi:hypothetical protein